MLRSAATALVTLLVGLLALVGLVACGAPPAEPAPTEAEPVAEAAQALSTFDCAPSDDTGYDDGQPFSIQVVTVDGKPVETATANAYYQMALAADAAGIELHVVSGFRTMAEQQYLYACYINCNCNNCNLAAQPGYSNHQSGHALDLSWSSGGYAWLDANAGAFGFTRTVPSENWHWEWWGGGPGGGPCGACGQPQVDACGQFGCNCAGQTCSGGFCPGNGCGGQETDACAAFGCGCVDHACSGGFCPGTGCTAKETLDCGNFGCGCVDHACSGGFCPGTGCTAKELTDCSAQGCGCAGHACTCAPEGGGGGGGGAVGGGGGGDEASGGATGFLPAPDGPSPRPDGATWGRGGGGEESGPSDIDSAAGCRSAGAPRGASGVGLLAVVLALGACRWRPSSRGLRRAHGASRAGAEGRDPL